MNEAVPIGSVDHVRGQCRAACSQGWSHISGWHSKGIFAALLASLENRANAN